MSKSSKMQRQNLHDFSTFVMKFLEEESGQCHWKWDECGHIVVKIFANLDEELVLWLVVTIEEMNIGQFFFE